MANLDKELDPLDVLLSGDAGGGDREIVPFEVGEERVDDPERRTDVQLRSWASSNADPFDEDRAGLPPLEDEAKAQDISPDVVRRGSPYADRSEEAWEGAEEAEEDEEGLTARPHDHPHPILPNELPEG